MGAVNVKAKGGETRVLYKTCDYKADAKQSIAEKIPKLLTPTVRNYFGPGGWIELCGEISKDFEKAHPGASELELTRHITTELENRTNSTGSFKELQALLATMLAHVVGFAAFMKDPAFEVEMEWRIAAFVANCADLKFRTSQSGLVPYVEIPLSEPADPKKLFGGLLKRIVVGPLGFVTEQEKKNTIGSVKMLLQKHGLFVKDSEHLDGVIVESSAIPLRRW
jgi:hypothetical protein